MKPYILSSILICSALFMPISLHAEVVQLVEVSSFEKADWFKQYSEKELAEIQEIKNLLITFVKSSSKTQLKLVSRKFKSIYKNTGEVLSAAFSKESYPKIDFRKIEYLDKGNATIKVNLYWSFEGYEGIQTYYFILIKEEQKWLIDWMVF